MGRSESKQVTDQSLATSANFQNQANQSYNSMNQDLAGYRDYANNFAANNPFRSPRRLQDENLELSATASGGQNSLEDYYNNLGTRTGQPTTAQMTTAGEEGSRQGRRDLMNAEGQQRLRDDQLAEQHDVQAAQLLQFAPELLTRMYGTGVSGATSALEPAAKAAQTPGFWDTFLPALVQGAGAAAGGYFTGGVKKPPAGNKSG